mmetsp:Transcript_9306/g.20452  ORF Transcript_9306/g.20452 Transcript_9306/m.20452 type:complete len:286 (-) Transcript_9306:14-871(-)
MYVCQSERSSPPRREGVGFGGVRLGSLGPVYLWTTSRPRSTGPTSGSPGGRSVGEEVVRLAVVLDLLVNGDDHGEEPGQLVPLGVARVLLDLVGQRHVEPVLRRLQQHAILEHVHRDVLQLRVGEPDLDQELLASVAGCVRVLEVHVGVGGVQLLPWHDLVPGDQPVVALLLHDDARRRLELLGLPDGLRVRLLGLPDRHLHVGGRLTLLPARPARQRWRQRALLLLDLLLDPQDLHEARHRVRPEAGVVVQVVPIGRRVGERHGGGGRKKGGESDSAWPSAPGA